MCSTIYTSYTLKHNFKTVGFSVALLLSSVAVSAQAPDSTVNLSYQRHSNSILPTPKVQKPEFNQGFMHSPEQLINGKIAGLRIGQNSGQPGTDPSLMLHNYNTLFGLNEPLVVLDGQVIPFRNMGSYHSFLSFINLEDLASIAFVTADAGIAVYGEQAANGVLFLNTKQPGGSPKVSYSGKVAVSRLRKKVDVLDAAAFSEVIRDKYPDEAHLLGTHNTDWQDVIFRDAVSHDHHISISGALAGAVPYRVSAGHQNQQGIMEYTWNKRNTLALRLSPELLNKQLQLNVNLSGSQQDGRIAAPYVYNNALHFDPTQPVYDPTSPGGYFNYKTEEGYQNTIAPLNPLQILKDRPISNDNTTLVTNASATYAPAILPGMRVGLQYGYQDFKSGNVATYAYYDFNSTAPRYYEDQTDHTYRIHNGELKLSYDLPQLVNDLAITTAVGVAYNRSDYKYNLKNLNSRSYYYTENGSRTLYGQTGLTYKQAYNLSAVYASQNITSNVDAHSHFAFSTSADLVKNGMLQSSAIRSLKLYGSYLKFNKTQVAPSDKNVIKSPYLKPENIKKFIVGSSASLIQDKLQANLYYTRTHTKDMWLLVSYYNPNGYNWLRDNLSDLTSNTLALDLNYQVLQKGDFSWNLNSNLSFSRNQINEIPFKDGFYYQAPGQSFLNQMSFVLMEGKPANTFSLFQQPYDVNGKPLDNSSPTERKRVQEQSADPTFIVGLGTDVSYKKFSLGMLFRGQTGSYVYNFRANNQGASSAALGSGFLMNLNESYLRDGLDNRQGASTHYLENASYLRLEYLQLAYNAGSIFNDKAKLNISAAVQNAFVLTKYSGQDPEYVNGVEDNQYPVPVTYSLGLNLDI